VGVVLVFRDIAERRRIENERRAASAERERLLDSERAARAEAERASRVKDDFVATVSHELRTPLNAILGWAELLRVRKSDPAIVEQAVEVIGRNTRAQAQLISDLLDISRIVAGKLRLEVDDVDLARVIEEGIQALEPSALARSIAIHRTIEPDVEPVHGDRDRLQQIVWNLLSNAIKFTPEGGSIRVTLRSHAGHAEIAVADTGVGISAPLLPRVFDRFRQSDSPTTRPFGGLGLGLAIVKHLVELHGGRILAESDGEGQGATFTVRLPITSWAKTLSPSSDPEIATGAPQESSRLADIHVLAVDDDLDTLELLRRMLEGRGARVTTAASAAEALAALSQEPDLLVSDIGLPEMDGYELMRNIRAESSHLGPMPAIALTAFVRPEDRTRALGAGYQSHLAKPVEPGELLATVASFADMIRARRRAGR
jgi:CheY-like chemotaxis protein/nitrogen-specific signal transduction histidine kinase